MTNVTDVIYNVTTTAEPPAASLPQSVGLVAAFGASLFFGSYYIPTKKFTTGDGVFFQWVMCSAILNYGAVFNLIIGNPSFEPLAMVGGALWATGNLVCIIVIRCIGVGVGQNIWSLISLLLGWADGRFGLFGAASTPSIEWLQYFGVALSIVRGILAAFIVPGHALKRGELDIVIAKTGDSRQGATPAAVAAISGNNGRLAVGLTSSTSADFQELTVGRMIGQDQEEQELQRNSRNYGGLTENQRAYVTGQSHYQSESEEPRTDDSLPVISSLEIESDFVDRLTVGQKRILGVSLALFAGVNFGLQFATVNVLKLQGHSQQDKDYSFPFYTGTFLASSVYMIIYALAKRNKPFLTKQLLAPAFCSGLIWVLGQTCWFYANEALSQSITFPIMSACPSLVSLTWGYFFFREIRGKTNSMFFISVIVVTIASVLMIAFSM